MALGIGSVAGGVGADVVADDRVAIRVEHDDAFGTVARDDVAISRGCSSDRRSGRSGLEVDTVNTVAAIDEPGRVESDVVAHDDRARTGGVDLDSVPWEPIDGETADRDIGGEQTEAVAPCAGRAAVDLDDRGRCVARLRCCVEHERIGGDRRQDGSGRDRPHSAAVAGLGGGHAKVMSVMKELALASWIAARSVQAGSPAVLFDPVQQ